MDLIDWDAVDWLEPWQRCAAGLETELYREVGRQHPLADCQAVSVARRVDCDDVLFALTGSPALFAVVHLTWTGQRERRRDWPSTELYGSLAEWVERRMKPDHVAWKQAGG